MAEAVSFIATAVKHLLAAGVTGDALVAAIAELEACAPSTAVDVSAARRRERDAAYQAEKRAARKTSSRRQTSADVGRLCRRRRQPSPQ